MLTQVHIRDLATIASLDLYFQNGCTMITGETGSGKSIFIEAIELGLGGRATQHMIRAHKEKAEITLCFDITHYPKVIEQLKSLDFYHDAPECMIRRILTQDGRSRAYVNGSPCNLQLLKELGELLFHLHSQHDQQALQVSENQRDMLDRYAHHTDLVLTVKKLAKAWRDLEQCITTLREKTNEEENRREFLHFQLEELQTIDLKPGEWAALEAEHRQLMHAETILNHLQQAIQLLSEEQTEGAKVQLKQIRKIFETLVSIAPQAKAWIESLHAILVQLDDLESDLQHLSESISHDPEKIQQLEYRISQIFNLARKHKKNPESLDELKKEIENELETLRLNREKLITLQAEQEKIAAAYDLAAAELSKSRLHAKQKLEQTITTTIRSLSLPHGEFKIHLEKSATENFPAYGKEKIVFLIKTNPDQIEQPLAKVISGGELSRLSLAMHLALAKKTAIPILVFDEVDTGVSGAIAEKIGKLLRKLGESYQVFCITHLAQVAALGHQHLLVEKYFIEKVTYTRLRQLDAKEKTREIARLLGGENITQKTLSCAEEILSLN